jgi:dTDP-4-dehydrorhamnose reductase
MTAALGAAALRMVLLGGSGQIGSALRETAGVIVTAAPSRAEFDICRDDLDRVIDSAQADVVVNCAAFHNTDACERDPSAAFDANTVAVDRLAAACARRDVAFVTISSDYVFAGDATRPYREDDSALPRTVYGASKLAGEILAQRHGRKHLIVRTSGVFGAFGTSSKGVPLIERVLSQAIRGEPTRMVDDITFSPTYAPHVAAAIVALIVAQAWGTHHVTNGEYCTWFEFVATVFSKAGLTDAPLEPIQYATLGNPTQRPMYSPLENTTFAAVGVAPLPPWQSALDEFLAARSRRISQ